MIFGDVNLMYICSFVHKESKCIGISMLCLKVYEIKAFYFFIFNSGQQQCNILTWKIQGF
jgi:hypothetical protein